MSDVIVLIWVWFVLFVAVSLAIFSIINLYQNRRIGFDKGFLYVLSACLLAATLSFSIWPPVYRVYQDEVAFISQSVNIVTLGKAGIILKGDRLEPETLAPWTASPKLPGFACLEAIILFLTKDFEHSYFLLNIVLGVLTIAAVYRIVWLWTASHSVAWWAAIFLACLPVRISYSMSAASDIAGFLFFMLFLLFISEYKAFPRKHILYAALFAGIYSVCVKPFYAIFFVLGLTIALNSYLRNGLLDRKSGTQVLWDLICLGLPIVISIPVAYSADLRSGNYSIAFVFNNLYAAVSYLFNCTQNTIVTTLAALCAVFRCIFYKRCPIVIACTAWLIIGILMMSVFNSGGFLYPGNVYSDRYFLFLAFPYVFLAARGIVDVPINGATAFWAVLLFIILILNSVIASRNLDEKAKRLPYYSKMLLFKRLAPVVPKNAYVIEESAALLTAHTFMKSIQTRTFLDGDHPDEVVFLRGLKDFSDPNKTILVENILNVEYDCKPLADNPLKEQSLFALPVLCVRNKDQIPSLDSK